MKKILLLLTLLLTTAAMNAQKNEIAITLVDIPGYKITIEKESVVEDTYQWLMKKRVFAVDPGTLGSVGPACKIEFLGDSYKYKMFYVYIRSPEQNVEGAITATELFDLYELLGTKKLVRYFTRPENLKPSKQETAEWVKQPKGSEQPKGSG